jgi:hypothetical protein
MTEACRSDQSLSNGRYRLDQIHAQAFPMLGEDRRFLKEALNGMNGGHGGGFMRLHIVFVSGQSRPHILIPAVVTNGVGQYLDRSQAQVQTLAGCTVWAASPINTPPYLVVNVSAICVTSGNDKALVANCRIIGAARN